MMIAAFSVLTVISVTYVAHYSLEGIRNHEVYQRLTQTDDGDVENVVLYSSGDATHEKQVKFGTQKTDGENMV